MNTWLKVSGLLALAILGATGCGGDSKENGDVAGVVFDQDGNVVRGARVYYDLEGSTNKDVETVSNSSGAYVLTGIAEGDKKIWAVITQGTKRYVGVNVVRINRGERTKGHNIVVSPDDQQGVLYGNVRDRNGFNVQGARVFARQASGVVLSSSYGITDDQGNYRILALQANVTYEVISNGRQYRGDTDSVVIRPGEELRADFVLGNTTNPSLPVPLNFSATAWTSPDEPSRSQNDALAIEGLKRQLDPTRVARKPLGRLTADLDPIEVDLVWDRIVNSQLLGYGMYRSTNGGTSFQNADFVRDPLAEFYADADVNLRENRSYTYAITSLSTDYPDTNESESNYSTFETVNTLGSLKNVQVGFSPLRFIWNSATGADRYAVFLYDEAPGLGTTSIWNNFASPTSTPSLTYSGPSLVAGRDYWIIVLGFNLGQDGRTISRVVKFRMN
ncbi:MAG: carboxypeptidase-like regulatory domain-containing protein [Fimbriimonas sp.]